AAQRAFGGGPGAPRVDEERLTRDPSSLVAREVDGAPADVPAGPLGAERARPAAPLARRAAEILDHGRPHRPGGDRIDADTLRPALDCHRADESPHAGLGAGAAS